MPSGYRSAGYLKSSMKKPVQHDAVQLQIVQLVHQLITEEDVCEDDNTLYDIKFSQNL